MGGAVAPHVDGIQEGQVMNIKTLWWAIAAIVSVTTITAAPTAHAQGAGRGVVVTNGPQTDPGAVSPTWSARRNVTDSKNYDRLLESDSAFRQARIRKECGPINDPQLHASCIASFSQDEPVRRQGGQGR
jgi:hypothetical protein